MPGQGKHPDVRNFEKVAALMAHETVTDGRLQVAEAIAEVTTGVKVDSSVVPFKTTPENLFDLKFSDDPVFITTTDGMDVFIAHLRKKLPQIKDQIDKIPANPTMDISLVVFFVKTALNALGN